MHFLLVITVQYSVKISPLMKLSWPIKGAKILLNSCQNLNQFEVPRDWRKCAKIVKGDRRQARVLTTLVFV